MRRTRRNARKSQNRKIRPDTFNTRNLEDLQVSRSVNDPARVAPHVRDSARVIGFKTANNRAAASELLNIAVSQTQVKASRRKLNVPVVVLTAGRNTDPEWRRMQRDQVGLSDRGCQIVAVGAGHVISLSQPGTVAKAIRAIVEATRNGTDANLCQPSS